MARTATNPQTGERVQYNEQSGQWEPMGGDFDFSASRMVQNIPGSAVQLGKDMAAPFIHPVQTFEALKGLDKETVKQILSDRYGGIENLQRTLENDPVGLLSDVAGVLTGGGALAGKAPGMIGKAGRIASKAGRIADPVNIAAQAAVKTAARVPGIQKVPGKLFESSAKFSTTKRGSARKAAAIRKRNVETALRERIMPTEKGITKAERLVDRLNSQIDGIIDAAEGAGTKIDPDVIIKAVDSEIAKRDVPGAYRTKDIKRLEKLRQEFVQNLQGETSLTPRQVQNIKKDVYTRVDFKQPSGTRKFIKEQGEKAIARGARRGVGQIDPLIDILNRREGDLLELLEPLQQSASRIGNRDPFGLSAMLGAGFGGSAGSILGGPAGGGIGALGGAAAMTAINAPRAQARTAIILRQLIDAGLSPSVALSMAPLLAGQASKTAGRARNDQ